MPGVRKAGHTGTLDPLATGVLPVCINEGTKLAQFLSHDHKEYTATVLLGTATDTLDIDGKIVARSEPAVSEKDIENVLHGFVGSYEQEPPLYSAIKYKGKAMYKWARAGFSPELIPRTIEIFDLEMIRIELPYVTFQVSCSKGTYVRSLCRDIGAKLGCPACLSGLRRTRSGHFPEKSAVSIESRTEDEMLEILEEHLIPMSDALPGLPAVSIGRELGERVRTGYHPNRADLLVCESSFAEGDMVKFTIENGSLVAVGRMLFTSGNGGCINSCGPGVKILRVFNQ